MSVAVGHCMMTNYIINYECSYLQIQPCYTILVYIRIYLYLGLPRGLEAAGWPRVVPGTTGDVNTH